MQRRTLILLLLLLAGASDAAPPAVLANRQTALALLTYYCRVTHARAWVTQGRYVVQRGRRRLTFRLFDRTLMAGKRHRTVPIPPMWIRGVTYIPLRAVARYFGDTVIYGYNKDAGVVGHERTIAIVNRYRAYPLVLTCFVAYLDTHRVALQSCAFMLMEDTFDEDDIFIARRGRIIWAGCSGSNYSVLLPPRLIHLRNGVNLIAFTGIIGGAHMSEMQYQLYRLTDDRVRNVLPEEFFCLPCTTGEAGIVLHSTPARTRLIVYQAYPVEIAYATTPKHGSYTLSWYQWEHGQFRLRHTAKSPTVELYNPMQLRRVFAQYHITGQTILTDTEVARWDG